MKTKAGNYMLKELTKKMDELNKEAFWIAKRLDNCDPRTSDRYRDSVITQIIDEYEENRARHLKHQQTINRLVELENLFLEDKNEN